MGKVRCENCIYWHDVNENDKAQCRRNPPMVQFGGPEGVWPTTFVTQYCGEFVHYKSLSPYLKEIVDG